MSSDHPPLETPVTWLDFQEVKNSSGGGDDNNSVQEDSATMMQKKRKTHSMVTRSPVKWSEEQPKLLKVAKQHSLARERSIRHLKNTPPSSGSSCEKSGNESNLSLMRKRMNEHKGDFRIVGNELFCILCKRNVKPKSSVFSRHIKCNEHAVGRKKKLQLDESALLMQKTVESWKKQKLSQSNLSDATISFRIDTLRSLLRAGVPLQKLKLLRTHYENYAHLSLTDRSNMSQFIPHLLQEELELILRECNNHKVVVIFDGTTTVGEIFGVIFRWVDERFTIHQRCVHVGMYESSMNHEELADAIMRVVSQKYHFEYGEQGTRNGKVLAWMHDRASVNACACDFLRRIYVGSLDHACLSHTLCHCGDKLATEFLKHLMTDLRSLFSVSNRARVHWKRTTNESWPSDCRTRWWSFLELMIHVLKHWDAIPNFLQTATTVGRLSDDGVRIPRMIEFMENAEKRTMAHLELLTVCIVGAPICSATYILEGDGPTSIIAYDILENLGNIFRTHIPQMTFPTVEAAVVDASTILHELPVYQDYSMEELQSNLREHIRSFVVQSANYFGNTVMTKLADQVSLFNVCRIVNPLFVKINRPLPNNARMLIESLQYFNDDKTDSMILEWNRYQDLCNDLVIDDMAEAPPPNPTSMRSDAGHMTKKYQAIMSRAKDFWQFHSRQLPSLADLARYLMSMATSSAAAERLFSILKSSFADQQQNALEDYVTLSLQYQYNDRQY